jgi:hypothetical protein
MYYNYISIRFEIRLNFNFSKCRNQIGNYIEYKLNQIKSNQKLLTFTDF